jgi:hypothetical protein
LRKTNVEKGIAHRRNRKTNFDLTESRMSQLRTTEILSPLTVRGNSGHITFSAQIRELHEGNCESWINSRREQTKVCPSVQGLRMVPASNGGRSPSWERAPCLIIIIKRRIRCWAFYRAHASCPITITIIILQGLMIIHMNNIYNTRNYKLETTG